MKHTAFSALMPAALALFVGAGPAQGAPAPEKGPRMTDAEFFAALDLKLPGMQAVAQAAGRQDWPAARAALLARLGQTIPKPALKRDAGYNRAEADAVCRHLFTFYNHQAQLPEQIDWTYRPGQDREWTWALNRHGFWDTLANAYLNTGDERYAREFDAEAASWVESCPVPPRVDNGGPCWRTIEAGIRGSTWVSVIRAFFHAPGVRDDTKIALLKSVIEHCRYLAKNPTGGNWVMIETNGLLALATTFPEFAESDGWVRLGYQRFESELARQVYPDGMQEELSTLYHMVCVGTATGALERSQGREALVPAEFRQSLERMYAAAMSYARGDGTVPMINDADALDIRSSLAKGASLFHRSDFRYVATGGKEGVAPRWDSILLPYAGFAIQRSGWTPDDRFLILDAGPYGGHSHEDALNFDCSAFGQPLIVDPGRWSYDGDATCRFLRGSFGHNLVLVDGQQQARGKLPGPARASAAPRPGRWVSTPAFDYCEGRYEDGYGPQPDRSVQQWRRILFVKPDYWVVSDRLEGTGHHRFDALFHFAPGKAAVNPQTKAMAATFAHAGVRLLPLLPAGAQAQVIEGAENPVQGWVSWQYGKREPAPTGIYTWDADAPTSAAFVVVPGEAGAPEAECSPLAVQPEGAAAFTVKTAAGTDTLLIAPGVAGVKRFGEFETDAELAVVRAAPDGRIRSASAWGGKSLSRRGEVLWRDGDLMPPADPKGPEKTRVSIATATYLCELTTRRGLEVRLPAQAERGRPFVLNCTYRNGARPAGEALVLRVHVPRIAAMGLKPSAWGAAAEERFASPAPGESVRQQISLPVPADLPAGRHPLLVEVRPASAVNQQESLVLHAGVEVQ